MKKTWIVPMTLMLALVSLGAATAGAATGQGVPAPPAVSSTDSPVLGQCEPPALSTPAAPIPLDLLLAPEPIEMAPPCRIRCPTTWCQSDSQCTAAPGGTCSPVCISRGCCTYPA